MKVLIDAAHPADVWTLGAVEDRLLAEGAETLWISRPGKDCVVELIEGRARPHKRGPQAGTNMLSLAKELILRDFTAWKAARKFNPDVILTRSPAGVHAGRATRTPVIYDTDDGHAAGILYYVAGPLATVIASPLATDKTYGSKHRKYRSYKELFYLHPFRFKLDNSIRAEVGAGKDEKLIVLRLTAFTASHDVAEKGLTRTQVERLLALLKGKGRVVISSEKPLPDEFADMRFSGDASRFHHLLAAADLVVGDSQTVCSEAAVLGTPSLRFNSWAGRLPYQNELEHRWGLTQAFELSQEEEFFGEVTRLLSDLDAANAKHAERRAKMLEWSEDPVDVFVEWVYELSTG